MDHKEALEFAIAHTKNRINEIGDLARKEIDEDGKNEQWAALRSAQGGMIEVLDMMEQCQAMATSFDLDREKAKNS